MLSLRYREGVLSLRYREGVLSLRYREGPPCSEGLISFCLFSPLLRGVNASLLAFEKHVVLVGGGLATAFGFGHLNTTLSPFAMASNPAGVCAGASPPVRLELPQALLASALTRILLCAARLLRR